MGVDRFERATAEEGQNSESLKIDLDNLNTGVLLLSAECGSLKQTTSVVWVR